MVMMTTGDGVTGELASEAALVGRQGTTGRGIVGTTLLRQDDLWGQTSSKAD